VTAVLVLTRSKLVHGPISLPRAQVVEVSDLAAWIVRRPVKLETSSAEHAHDALATFVAA